MPAEFIPFLFVGFGLLAYLFVLSFTMPTVGLAAVFIVSIFIPIEISMQWGSLPRIGPTRIVVGVFILAYILRYCYVSRPDFDNNESTKHVYWMYYLAIYVCAIILSYFNSIDAKASAFFIVDQLVIFVMIFILLHEVADDKNWMIIKQAIYVSTALVCLYALVEAWNSRESCDRFYRRYPR